MKIGVMSNVPRTGKTTVMMSFAHVYSRSQGKVVAIFSTASLSSVTDALKKIHSYDTASTPGVLRAFLETGSISGKEILDYAVKSGKDEVYVYDTIDTKDEVSSIDFLKRTIRTVSTDLILVEIKGDPTTDSAKNIMNECDAILNVFNLDNQSISAVKEYAKSLDVKMAAKMRYLVNHYDDRIITEKKLSGLTKIAPKFMCVHSYSPLTVKLFLEGDYDIYADRVVYGHEDFTDIRTQCLKEIQMFFNTEKRKRVREVSDWPKRGVN